MASILQFYKRNACAENDASTEKKYERNNIACFGTTF